VAFGERTTLNELFQMIRDLVGWYCSAFQIKMISTATQNKKTQISGKGIKRCSVSLNILNKTKSFALEPRPFLSFEFLKI